MGQLVLGWAEDQLRFFQALKQKQTCPKVGAPDGPYLMSPTHLTGSNAPNGPSILLYSNTMTYGQSNVKNSDMARDKIERTKVK